VSKTVGIFFFPPPSPLEFIENEQVSEESRYFSAPAMKSRLSRFSRIVRAKARPRLGLINPGNGDRQAGLLVVGLELQCSDGPYQLGVCIGYTSILIPDSSSPKVTNNVELEILKLHECVKCTQDTGRI